ncbi:MAG: PSD1 and planctomycete cytochrome C domain-containing protein [Rubripirellula sp.]
MPRLHPLFVLTGFLLCTPCGAEPPLRFNRDIRAVLTDKCLACHGPDAKTVEGGLRLDLRDDAIESGAIVPGDADASELVRRIFSTDDEDLMPPPHAHKPMSPKERELLRRWVSQGAQYEPHWAYAPMQRTKSEANPSGEIDRFISDRLASERVQPTPEADRITLLRRLSFDLTGLPPTPAEVDAFLGDKSEDAFQKQVDRLLESQRFGERMAIYWLDLVRYADTVGYHGDQNVSQSPYRDYVIKAFNKNMPYDQFVREQLAGDLLPDATLEQRVASGYNRLNQTTEEGGSQAKEYLAIYFADRVRNVSQVFMGATVGCAQCHDHKYDPYTARDFYSLGAFFADLEERGVYSGRSREPMIRVPTPEIEQQLVAIDQRIAKLKSKVQPLRQMLIAEQSSWETEARKTIDEQQEVETAWVDDAQDTGGNQSGSWNFVGSKENAPVYSGKKSRRQTSDGLVQHFFEGAKEKVKVTPESQFYAWVYLDPKNPPKAIMLQLNDGNWSHRSVWGSDDIPYGRQKKSHPAYFRAGKLPPLGEWTRLEVAAANVGLATDREVNGMAFTQFGGQAHWDKAGWIASQGMPTEVAQALLISADKRDPSQAKTLQEHFLANAPRMIKLKQQIANAGSERKKVEEMAPRTVVSISVKPREIRILARGNWMDDSGEVVDPAIPAFLGKLDVGGERPTRLDLANWLCKPENPLTARTMVNRLWSLMFGRGICASVDDFGGQGTFPSYPDLLDWLAIEFVESKWDIKHVLRTIVNSDAYKRSSKPSPELREGDPYNDLFARQGRHRIDAEMVRDAALLVSGLLQEQVGGASVRPYQPAGYYAQLNFPKRTYVPDPGQNQYRRGVYTHWQRTFLHPMLKAFDAPSREECTAARSRSNTPLQALALLNDPTFVEAARVFAARTIQEGGQGTDQRITWAYRAVVSRTPETEIATELRLVFDQHLQHYRNHPDDAHQLITTGSAPTPRDINPAELAAWTGVARVILNLHESIMRY